MVLVSFSAFPERVYFDRYEKDRIDQDLSAALGELIGIAGEVADIARFTGLKEPTLIT